MDDDRDERKARRAVPRDEALRVLAEHQADLGRFHVTSLALFGSVARDEAGPDSDVDLLVEFDRRASVGLFTFVELQWYLEDLLECRVDLVMPGALRPRILDHVLREAIRAA